MDLLIDQINGNSPQTWLTALGITLAIYVTLLTLKHLFKQRKPLSPETKLTAFNAFRPAISKTYSWVLIIIAIYFGSQALELSPKAASVLSKLLIIAVFIQFIIWANTLVDFYASHYRARNLDTNLTAATAITVFAFIGKVILITALLMLGLDQMGFDITTLVAGLGVGGVAIALAVQNILGDLFASLSIIMDRPFVVGDFLAVGDLLGTVERVGLKTTRLRSLSGEMLIFPNSDLLQSRIRNYKQMFERRVSFQFGVIYQTPYQKLQKIPDLLKEIVEKQNQVRFDRTHFFSYGNSSLDFEVVFYVLDPDYNLYMDIRQAIHLEMFERFEQEGISFAYPTRTIFIERGGGENPATHLPE